MNRSSEEALGAVARWHEHNVGRKSGVDVAYAWRYTTVVNTLTRITADPEVMGGRPCIRGMRVTVGTIVGMVAAGRSGDEILKLYPYLEPADITEALAYAAWRSDEFEVTIASS